MLRGINDAGQVVGLAETAAGTNMLSLPGLNGMA